MKLEAIRGLLERLGDADARGMRKLLPALHGLWVCALIAGLAVRAGLASQAMHPGYADPSLYLKAAENLVDGRGLTVDYIWHFLGDPRDIPRPSHDYWMPLPSVVIACFLWAFGRSVPVALIPSVLLGLALSLVTYRLSIAYSSSRHQAIMSSLLVFSLPLIFLESVKCDAVIYSGFFLALGLYLIATSAESPKRLVAAALVSGLAHLARQDGFLLLPLIVAAALRLPLRFGLKWRYIAQCLVTHAAVLAPLLVLNYRKLGSPLPSYIAKVAFLTQYLDLYAYSKDLSLASYLNWGMGNIVHSKWHAVLDGLESIHRQLGTVLALLAVAGTVNLLRRRSGRQWAIALPHLAFLVLLFVFYPLVVTFPSEGGSFFKAAFSMMPFLVVVAVDAAERILRFKTAVLALMSVLVVVSGVRGFELSRSYIQSSAVLDRQHKALGRILAEDARNTGGRIRVMTSDPWDFHYSTGLEAVQIPNESRDVIVEAAVRYRVTHLVLPAPRRSLMAIFTGARHDSRFQLVGGLPDSKWKVYRIVRPGETGGIPP